MSTFKQRTDKSGRPVTNIQIKVEDYQFFADNVKYPEVMSDTVHRFVGFVKKKMGKTHEDGKKARTKD